ncbi:hypothetical protein [Desulfonema magnum]|uniref:Uncharacterized protein n=1 Tax=Desulfonema magnum TaxID=45655 RepID=A0A975BK02_9BACT|nr:hypothetical protein [Desulfonema magnum]QTA87037.1 Uncharacterized protein dnm_030640 [Desulfonema magnum]
MTEKYRIGINGETDFTELEVGIARQFIASCATQGETSEELPENFCETVGGCLSVDVSGGYPLFQRDYTKKGFENCRGI